MQFIKLIFLPALALLTLASCNKTTVSPDEALLGQWNVTRVQGQQFNNGIPGILLTDSVPTGYIRFDNNGWGEQNYSFNLFGTNYPFHDSFKWESNASEIRIDQIASPDMVWTRQLSEPAKQVASYTFVISVTMTIQYTLTLEK